MVCYQLSFLYFQLPAPEVAVAAAAAKPACVNITTHQNTMTTNCIFKVTTTLTWKLEKCLNFLLDPFSSVSNKKKLIAGWGDIHQNASNGIESLLLFVSDLMHAFKCIQEFLMLLFSLD